MQRLGLFIISLTMALIVTSCSSPKEFRLHAQQNLLQESWFQQINTNPNVWLKDVDPWFITGEPRDLFMYATHAPIDKSISHMMVRVSRFSNINIDGDFKVQIMGNQDAPSVEIIGSNESIRQISVDSSNHTLNLRQFRDPKSMRRNGAIVRIGMRNLRNLTDCGNGSVVGRGIFSDNMVINSTCGANITLSGRMNVRQVIEGGTSNITVIGAYAPNVDIKANGFGSVNMSGRVGVQSISSYGKSHVNIIGADSNRLVINAGESSVTRIAGSANVKSVNASGGSCVYMYWVNSNGLRVFASDAACVGLAGCVTNLQVRLSGSSRFQGQFLKARSAYVTTVDHSHANVAATDKVFAQASGISSIYYSGNPSKISRFVSDKGAIIAVWTDDIPTPAVVSPQYTTWDFKRS